jgi:hypothetical protein
MTALKAQLRFFGRVISLLKTKIASFKNFLKNSKKGTKIVLLFRVEELPLIRWIP